MDICSKIMVCYLLTAEKMCIRDSTKDRSTPVIRLENIAKSAQVKRVLSDLIEKEREDKKVVGRDMYGAVSHIDPVEFDGDGDMDDHNFN